MRARLQAEEGFGLVELLISMVVLNVGILALVAALNSGAMSLRRASETATATVLAERQIELYRGARYADIRLQAAAVTAADATYTADSAYTTMVTDVAPATVCSTLVDACNPSRTTTGPDGRSYRVDTYVASRTPTSGRALKLVTVVVRSTSTLRPLARVSSTFDPLTG